ncbi:hypothetical protein ACVWYF_004553 [Hymenobacter sp. UYAg731]
MNSWHAIHSFIETSKDSFSPYESGGFAAYYYLLHQSSGEAAPYQKALALLSAQLADIERQAATITFEACHTNVVALAWAYHKLRPDLPPQAATAVARVDQILAAEAQKQGHGATSNAAAVLRSVRYFLARLPDAAAATHLQELIGAAYQSSRKPLTQAPGHKATDLSMGSGLMGELLVLMDVHNAGISVALLRDVVRQGIALLLSTKGEVNFLAGRYSVFPVAIEPSGERRVTNQLSWAHGDLGASLVLYQARVVLDDAELGTIADLVGLNTLLRKEERTTGLVDSRFGQGTAGVACLYHRLYRLTGNPAYQRGHRFWLAQTEEYLTHELATGSYAPGPLREALAVGMVLLGLGHEPALPDTYATATAALEPQGCGCGTAC